MRSILVTGVTDTAGNDEYIARLYRGEQLIGTYVTPFSEKIRRVCSHWIRREEVPYDTINLSTNEKRFTA